MLPQRYFRPLKPFGAQQNSWSFSSYACCVAWSVIIIGVPSFNLLIMLGDDQQRQIGGAILNAGLYSRRYSSVKDKCWLVTSHVTLRRFNSLRTAHHIYSEQTPRYLLHYISPVISDDIWRDIINLSAGRCVLNS